MSDSLKGGNSLSLLGIVLGNILVFFLFFYGRAIIGGDWTVFVKDFWEFLPAGLGVALIGIINAQLSSENKGRIVFMRWKNPLPGCEAFTQYAKTDPRVDIGVLAQGYGPLPTEPNKQNALWYRFYKSVENEPAVVQVHRAFLFERDYTCLSLMMAIILGVIGFFQMPSTKTSLIYFGFLNLQFLLAGQAARNHGKRFVTTVLAIKGAGR